MTERKIVDYTIVIVTENLVHAVKSLIAEGWHPMGAPDLNSDEPSQAMVRYAEPEPDNAALVAYRDRIVEDLQKLFTDESWIYTKEARTRAGIVRAILDKITSGEIGGAL